VRRRSLRIRSAIAFLALPGVVAIAVPLLIARALPGELAFHALGVIPLAAGLGLLLWCVREFYARGQGTLAPWDPPRRLVNTGVYRLSRNPMYLAVCVTVVGWATVFGRWELLVYALALLAAFHLRVLYNEEPWLDERHPTEWARYSAHVPRWLFRSRRALVFTWVAILLAIPAAGVFYETYAQARATRDFPPPGMLVDVGGRRLHLVCIGDGEPTVMMEPSGWGIGSLSAERVRQRVSSRARVCSYDRAGMGWSDPGPARMTTGDLARDLAVLQDRAGLHAPFVLVASSIGGLTVEMFARQYPERVAGLVFLDAASSQALPAITERSTTLRLAATGSSLGAHLGAFRLVDPFQIPVDAEDGRRAAALTYGARAIDGLAALVRALPDSAAEFEQAAPLRPDFPVVVFSASGDDFIALPGTSGLARSLAATRIASHQALAKSSSHGTWTLVPDSSHLIAESQPDVVAEVVLALVQGEPLAEAKLITDAPD
jgi:protein-S-isoprenylcysteine O-methyltransferase Ste14/pimeloyl-ACP methyl ester carboxylesterase